MAQQVEVAVDLGAGVPIEVIRQLIDDLDTVCQFGGELQYRVALANAERSVLRDPQRWITPRDVDGYFRYGPPPPWLEFPSSKSRRIGVGLWLPTELLDAAVMRYLEEFDPMRDTVTTVERIDYRNPFEIALGVGALALWLLTIVRDWPARRRLNNAVAADAENQMLARKEMLDIMVRNARNSELPLTPALINDLLTIDVANAMKALGDRRITLRELGAGNEESDQS
jgi:hypothetical protein